MQIAFLLAELAGTERLYLQAMTGIDDGLTAMLTDVQPDSRGCEYRAVFLCLLIPDQDHVQHSLPFQSMGNPPASGSKPLKACLG